MTLPLADLTEAQWSRQVYDLLALTGWTRRYHTYRSKKSPSGFPDEVIVRDRVIFLELKTERGKLSAAQKDWLRDLLAAGAEAYVVRPSDLDDLAAVLQHRGTLSDSASVWSGASWDAALRLRERTRAEAGA